MRGCIVLVLFIVFAGGASAQTIINSDSVASRLITEVEVDTSEGYIAVKDSIIYTYTGTNGGDLNHPIKFTKEDKLSFHPNLDFKDSTHLITLQTFSNADNIDTIKTFLSNKFKKGLIDRKLIYYDLNNNDTSLITQYEFSGIWTTGLKEVNRYDNNIKSATETTEWNSTNEDPYSATRNLTTYDKYNNATSIHIYFLFRNGWDSTNKTIIVNTYDSTHERTAETEMTYRFETGVQDTFSQTAYLYNANNKLAELRFYVWRSGDHKWYIQTIKKYSYDSNNNVAFILTYSNVASIFTYSPDSTSYIVSKKEEFTYNSFNQLISYAEKEYDTDNVMTGYDDYRYYYQNYMIKR